MSTPCLAGAAGGGGRCAPKERVTHRFPDFASFDQRAPLSPNRAGAAHLPRGASGGRARHSCLSKPTGSPSTVPSPSHGQPADETLAARLGGAEPAETGDRTFGPSDRKQPGKRPHPPRNSRPQYSARAAMAGCSGTEKRNTARRRTPFREAQLGRQRGPLGRRYRCWSPPPPVSSQERDLQKIKWWQTSVAGLGRLARALAYFKHGRRRSVSRPHSSLLPTDCAFRGPRPFRTTGGGAVRGRGFPSLPSLDRPNGRPICPHGWKVPAIFPAVVSNKIRNSVETESYSARNSVGSKPAACEAV